MPQPHCQMIQAGEIQAIVGDASRDGVGGTQYCGLWSLTSKHRVFNAFGNSYAGLIPGEIRGQAPWMEVVDEQEVALVREADEKRATRCRASYRVRGPHYVDHTLTFMDQADLLVRQTPTPFREISWCSYMNSPEDSRVRFISGGRWTGYMSPRHGVGSNIAPSCVPSAELEVFPAPADRAGMLSHFHWDRAEIRFDEPVYYGRLGEMALIKVFDRPRWLRFFLSPTGGGGSLLPGLSCPAWDFEWIIPEAAYAVGREYTLRMRLIYKRFVSEQDVLDEARRAQDELGFERV